MAQISIKDALKKAFVKVRPERAAIERLKKHLITLIDGINNNPSESEEFIKNLFSDFLKNTWYAPDYFINTHKRVDLVIHEGDENSPVCVLIEAKKQNNKNEMVSRENLNSKAFQELVYYYLNETIEDENINLKYLLITNAVEWFIFDAKQFHDHFYTNKTLVKNYKEFKNGNLESNKTDYFYTKIASPEIEKLKNEIEYCFFDISEYVDIIRNNNKEEENKLIDLYKILSPIHLLKKTFVNDSNTLNDNFYFELLYIMGLTEKKEDGKKIITRYEKGSQQSASLIEETIYQIEEVDEDMIRDISHDLCITWINRIIFLKLLESQQLQYQNNNLEYAFLNSKTIKTFNDLNILFFKVLAVETKNRDDNTKTIFSKVPYLNSSLFETTLNEEKHKIYSLRNEEMDIFPSTVLKDEKGNKRKGKIKLLDYLFEFLNAYDFSSEGAEIIQEENKTLINASVLGLIFEKINGYKDGSYFTPGFVTSYICSETIKNVVIEKFKKEKGWDINSIDSIFNKINNDKDIAEANKIINSITLVDPAVGSGHFLVSALNELIAIKSGLGILVDAEGKRIKCNIEVKNDELIITDEWEKYFEYKPNNKEKQRVQETLFQEKRRIIENCLFGVDINPNSVKICCLRLWIELLKNAYYTKESGYKELETLPNLNINIKEGNSLISRFNVNEDFNNNVFSLKNSIKEYKEAVQSYKNSNNKNENKKLLDKIKSIKMDYSENIAKNNTLYIELKNLENKLGNLAGENIELEFITEKEIEEKNKKVEKVKKAISGKKQEIDDFLHGVIYENAFEWRFEFPEVLDLDGKFIGFDAVIGNPPYIFARNSISKGITNLDKEYFYKNFTLSEYQINLYPLFIEKGTNVLKNNGVFCFIIPNNWLTLNTNKNIRQFILKQSNVSIINFYKRVFKYADVDNTILFFKKKEIESINENETIFIAEWENELTLIGEIKKEIFLKSKDYLINIEALKNNITFDLINKIENNSVPLATFAKIKCGLGAYGNGDGIPPQTKEMIKNRVYHSKKKEGKDWFKYIEGEDVKRYECSWLKKEYLKYGKHLREPRNDWKLFSTPRILVRQIPSPLPYCINACYVEETFLNDRNSMNIVYINTSPLFLLGVLNSKLISYWFANKFGKLQRGIFPQFKINELEKFPIPSISDKKQKPIITIVNKIISAKEKNPSSNTSKLEKQIDDIVYSLYQLTAEEIEIVEKNI